MGLPDILPETIETSAAARMAKVSDDTIRRWIKEGRIPGYKIVGRWKVDRNRYVLWLSRLHGEVQ